jgi:cytoskeletal protein RodZ
VSIGGTLAEARREAGLTVTQVSQRTRIREAIVSSIERGDFAACGGDFYARGHIRLLADAVGTDPVPLVQEYDQEHGEPAPLRASQAFEPSAPIRIRGPRRLRLGWVVAVAVLAAGGFASYHFLTVPAARPAATASRVRPVPSPAPHARVSPTARKTTTARTATRRQAVIRLTASQACWVRLSRTDGGFLYQGTIAAGASMTWHEKHPVSLVVGNPAGIVLTVNGKAERMNPARVVTLTIDPGSKTPVTVG